MTTISCQAEWGRYVVAARLRVFRILVPSVICGLLCIRAVVASDPSGPFGVRVVDQQTGRGVPLAELETVHHLRWVTDSGGWAAINEPSLMGQRVFFFVRSHGYTFPQDGFGFAGTRLDVRAGEKVTIKIQRLNLAERLYRVTGEGIYRDSVLLGEPTPLSEPLGSAMVAGQDSAFAELYQNKIHWFWGDTSRLSYPLGHFWMAAATSARPGHGGLDPAQGINLQYIVDQDGFSRPVARLGVERGVIWADGFLTLPDDSGRVRLVCHYAHMESLSKMFAHGLAVFNDDTAQFEHLRTLDMSDRRLFPAQAHPLRFRDGDVDYIYFGEVFPNVRVKAEWQSYVDPASYEVFTCPDHTSRTAAPSLSTNAEGHVQYEWRRGAQPIDGPGEHALVAAGKLPVDRTHFLPIDVEQNKTVMLHRGSVRWNDYRQCWIMIATEVGGSSHLGEVWYAEAAAPTGPWCRARKIVTHDQYSFYNPVHHSFFDQDGGRLIYFEGTYAQTFSGTPSATPRYDYNQVMYRLDLSDPRLESVRR